MQALEMEMDEKDLAPLVTRHGHSPRQRANHPLSLSPSSKSNNVIQHSRTTPQRQCLALLMVLFGMLFSTTMVYNIVNNAHPPWYYQARGVPLKDMVNNHNRTGSSNTTEGGGGNRTRA
jgi:hypothetical protein